MNPLHLDPTDILIDYHWGGQNSIVSALFEAFDRIDIDLMNRPPLYDHLDLEAVQAVLESTQSVVCIVATLWDFPIQITREQIQIHSHTER